MPSFGRDLLSRMSLTRVTTWMVSPWNTGFLKRMSVMPRLPRVVPSVVSATDTPTTRPSVNRLFTMRWPYSVFLENSSSRCSGCGLCVIAQNRMLSISVTVRVSGCLNSIPILNSS